MDSTAVRNRHPTYIRISNKRAVERNFIEEEICMNKRNFLLVIICALCVTLLPSCGGNEELNKTGGPNEVNLESATWQNQYDLGIRYLSEGNYEDAIAAFTAAIEIDATQALAYVGRGDAYARSGDSEENLAAALADYQAALELDRTLASAWLGLAGVYIRQGKYDQALETLQEGLEASGSDRSISDKIAEIEGGRIKDSSGSLRRLSGYDSSGKLAWYHIFDYNEAGQQILVTAYDAVGNQTGSMELLYDEEGRRSKSYSYLMETGEIDGYSEYEYDDKGNMVRSEYSKLGEEPNQYEIYEYNDDGICISSSRYQMLTTSYGIGDYYLSDSSEYDELGNETKQTWYDTNGNISGYYIYEYNSDGQRIRMNNCDVDGTIREYNISRYDDNGKFIGQEYYNADGSLKFSTAPSSDAS